ncbi:hypothetical protein MTO96_020332 [Rhipicephalus appendiculatus]
MTVDARPVVVVNSPRRCRMIPSLIDDDDTPKKKQQQLAGSTATAIPTLVTDCSSSRGLGGRQRSGHLHDYVVSINHGHVNDV